MRYPLPTANYAIAVCKLARYLLIINVSSQYYKDIAKVNHHQPINIKPRSDLVFVHTAIAEQYKCAVCLSVMANPSEIGCKFQHIFCTPCIATHFLHSSSCPQCRDKCSESEMKRMPFVERQINRLVVKCPNHKVSSDVADLCEAFDKKRTEAHQRRRRTQPVPGPTTSPPAPETGGEHFWALLIRATKRV